MRQEKTSRASWWIEVAILLLIGVGNLVAAPPPTEPIRTFRYIVALSALMTAVLILLRPAQAWAYWLSWLMLGSAYCVYEILVWQTWLLALPLAGALFTIFEAIKDRMSRLEPMTATEENFAHFQPIGEILGTPDNHELCSLLTKRIIDHSGKGLSLAELREEERVVLVVYQSMGIIGNGGFNYVFEQDFNGDPSFPQIAAAHETIGAASAAAAFRDALALFPESEPPEDVAQRLQIYRQGDGKVRHDIDSRYWNCEVEIVDCLATYIRSHRDEYVHLDEPASDLISRPRPASRSQTLPDLDLQSLPHWARVAFIARCARTIQPLFRKNWPRALPERVEAVERAIALAEQSAAEAKPADGLKEAKTNATIAAGAALFTLYGFDADEEPLPEDGNAATVASFVAKAAEKCAEAAACAPATSPGPIGEAWNCVRDIVGAQPHLLAAILEDFSKLQKATAANRWTDHSAVPGDFWNQQHS